MIIEKKQSNQMKNAMVETPKAFPDSEEEIIAPKSVSDEPKMKKEDLWVNLSNMIPFFKWEDGKTYEIELPDDLSANTKMIYSKFDGCEIPYLKIVEIYPDGSYEEKWLRISSKTLRAIIAEHASQCIKMKRTGKGLETKYMILKNSLLSLQTLKLLKKL